MVRRFGDGYVRTKMWCRHRYVCTQGKHELNAMEPIHSLIAEPKEMLQPSSTLPVRDPHNISNDIKALLFDPKPRATLRERLRKQHGGHRRYMSTETGTHLTGHNGFARSCSVGDAQRVGHDSAVLGHLQPELRAGRRAHRLWCRCALVS